MFSSLCLLKILFSLCWIEQRMDGVRLVRCVVFCTSSPRGWCGAHILLPMSFTPWALVLRLGPLVHILPLT
jgi:hypothetical protein